MWKILELIPRKRKFWRLSRPFLEQNDTETRGVCYRIVCIYLGNHQFAKIPLKNLSKSPQTDS